MKTPWLVALGCVALIGCDTSSVSTHSDGSVDAWIGTGGTGGKTGRGGQGSGGNSDAGGVGTGDKG